MCRLRTRHPNNKPIYVFASASDFEDKYDDEIIYYHNSPKTQSTATNTIELGLFPMIIDDKYIDGSVLMPGGRMPLNIFAMKFRSLFSKTCEGKEKAGMIFFDGPSKQYASIGTMIEIEKYQGLPDGRIMVLCIGRSRFQISEIIRPETDENYCRVRAEIIDDFDEGEGVLGFAAVAAAEEVWHLLKQVLEQTNRLHGGAYQFKQSIIDLAPRSSEISLTGDLPASWQWYPPTAAAVGVSSLPSAAGLRRRLFSLEAGLLLAGSAGDLQRMLQTRSTLRRLQMQRRALREAARLLAARLALKDAAVE
jgi:Lon protease-like protein